MGGGNRLKNYQTHEPTHIVPHPRTLRKAREQVKYMVIDEVSPRRIRNYLQRWAAWSSSHSPLLGSGPLRTVRASFPAYGSSLYKADVNPCLPSKVFGLSRLHQHCHQSNLGLVSFSA
jgi:hypothetical protein